MFFEGKWKIISMNNNPRYIDDMYLLKDNIKDTIHTIRNRKTYNWNTGLGREYRNGGEGGGYRNGGEGGGIIPPPPILLC